MFSPAMKIEGQSRNAVRSGVSKKGPSAFDKKVGERVRAARLLLDMSQEKLADALDPPLTFQQIQKYERGANRIGASRMQQIADVLKKPVSYFFGHSDNGAADDIGARALAAPHGVKLIKAFLEIRDNDHRALLASLAVSMAQKEARDT